MFTTQYFISALLLAIFAFVYSYVLTKNGEVLGTVYKKLYHLFKSDQRASDGLPRHPLFKVLIDCEKCVGGQWALWSFLLYQYKYYSLEMVLPHLLFITLTIYLTIIIKSTYIKFIE